jgi:type III secretion system HrpE/YscL family protein
MSAELSTLRPRRRIIPAAEAQAWIEGDAYREIAKRDAEALLAESRAVFEAERRHGVEAGLREGAEAKAALLAEATARIDRGLVAAEQQFAAAVVATVERVLGSFDRQELLVCAARHALAEMREARHLILRVAAEEAGAVERRLAEAIGPGNTLVEIQGDPLLAPGEAVLESELGFVSIGIEAQLAALRRGLGAPELTVEAAE